MSSTTGTPYTDARQSPVSAAGSPATLPFAEMAHTLWHRRWLIIGVVVAASLIGLLVLSSLSPRYRAQAVIALDRASNHSATFDTPLTSLVVDGETVASEIELIYSRELIGQVVVGQNLLATDEYRPADEDDAGSDTSWLARVRTSIKSWLPASEVETGKPDPVGAAIDQFRDNLDIQRKGISRAIVISFDAGDPARAAATANALASRYIDDMQRLQRDQEGVATEQLETKMSGVRDQLRATEQAIEEQRRSLGQVTPDGTSKVEQRLAGLNTRLINADAESAAARAELEQARALRDTPAAIDSIPATLASAAVGQLRERELNLQARLSELSTKYGEKHPLVQQVSSQIRQTRDSLGLEIDKTIGVLQSKATIAASRQQSIEQEMARLESLETAANPVKAELVGLQREAGSLRDRIAFLEQRISEVSQVNSLANLRPFARIISPAQVPAGAAFPNKKLLLPLIALLAGLAIVATLLGRCLYRHQLRTRLPVLSGNNAWVAGFTRPSGAARKPDALHAPADAALINVQKALPAGAPHTVMVTPLDAAHRPDGTRADGGSIAWRLAQASARRGRRTLHVDLTPLDTDHRKAGTGNGVVPALEGRAPVSQAVDTHPELPLDSLSAEGLLNDAAMLLDGERLQQCLADWAADYHTIIIDAPPVLNSPNAALINQACSLGLLVSSMPALLRKPGDLQQALQRLHKPYDRGLTGIIVNDLDAALFEPERFAYERSEHYLARLTGNHLPGTAAGLATVGARPDLPAPGTGAGLPASAAPKLDARQACRPQLSADRLSNVISLRRHKRPLPRAGETPSPLHGEAWVLQQSPERFTIRLSTPQAPREVGKSLAYLAEYLPLAWYNQGSRQHRTAVLIVGLFDSTDEVQAVLDSDAMAPIAEGAEPCVIATIQAEIVRHRQARAEYATEQ